MEKYTPPTRNSYPLIPTSFLFNSSFFLLMKKQIPTNLLHVFAMNKPAHENRHRFLVVVMSLIISLFISQTGNAQNSANYTFATNSDGSLSLDMNANAVDMSTGTTQIVGAGLDASAGIGVITIPFDVILMGNRFTQFSTQDDGLIQLGSVQVPTNTYTI